MTNNTTKTKRRMKWNWSGTSFWLVNKKVQQVLFSILPLQKYSSKHCHKFVLKRQWVETKKHQPKLSVFPCLHCCETSSLFASNAVVPGNTLPKPGGGLATTVLSVTCDEGVLEVCSCGWEVGCVVAGWNWDCCCGKESKEFQRSNTKTNETIIFLKTWLNYLRGKFD